MDENNKNQIEQDNNNKSPIYTENIKQDNMPNGKKKKSSTKKVLLSFFAILIFSCTSALLFSFIIPYINYNDIAITESADEVAEATIMSAETYEDQTTALIEQVSPSVVSITSSYYSSTRFANFEATAEGTGIIFEEDKDKIYIATNNHVIEGAKSAYVTIEDYPPVPAHLVGAEPAADLAVIYINKTDLAEAGITEITLATFGDSDELVVGEPVIAIGNAWGEGIVPSTGIVSATDKTITVEGKELEVIQTDAAINPGNSGGPLINSKGEVIGINTAKLSSSSSEGMGYAIPSNIAVPILESIMYPQQTPYLGIKGQTLSAQMAAQLGLPGGVYVVDVEKGTSADKAGIQRGDVITGFNGQPIFTFDDLTEAIGNCEVGQVVEIKIIRDGKSVTLNTKLMAKPSSEDVF